MLEKTIESFKRYINSQEQKLDDYYRMDEEFYKDEIEQLELSLKLLRTILNHLTKQDKMIELMSRFIDTELSSEHLSKVLKIDVKPLETYKENIKQYFEKKAEEAE